METLIEIFLIGLFGSMHCIGMCGGFVAMYSLKKPATQASLPHHLLYNLGRIVTYSLLGGLLGCLGSFTAYLGSFRGIPGTVLLIAGAVMVLMGMNTAGIIGKKVLFEDSTITSRTLFRRTLRDILALESIWGTFPLGLLLGFLPCGLLYPIFIQAAVSGGFFSGAVTTAVFGVGTVPAMMAFGFLVTKLRPHFKLTLYRIAAFLIILLGVQTLLRGMVFMGWILPGRFW